MAHNISVGCVGQWSILYATALDYKVIDLNTGNRFLDEFVRVAGYKMSSILDFIRVIVGYLKDVLC